MFLSQIKRGLSQQGSTQAKKAIIHNINKIYFQNQKVQGLLNNQRVASLSFKFTPQLQKPMSISQNNHDSQSYIDQMYSQWKSNEKSVDSTWQKYFQNIEGTASTPSSSQISQDDIQQIIEAISQSSQKQISESDLKQFQSDGCKIMSFIRGHMDHGHLMADVDPLQLKKVYQDKATAHYLGADQNLLKKMTIEKYGFTEQDLDRKFHINLPHWGGILAQKGVWSLREIRDMLQKAYCSKIGIEYMHIPNREQCNWIREQFELKQFIKIKKEQQVKLLDRLFWCDEFAQFIAQKYGTMKRFGLEGCESLIPGMKSVMDAIEETGAEKAIIGMPHRGRLNVLANVVRKPAEIIFAEFQGVMPQADKQKNWHENSGDVKYHLGTSFTRSYENGRTFTVEILANPSHLECVNPVVLGRVRAENHIRKQIKNYEERTKVVPILIHGDAAFSGQGICYETLQMVDLQDYTVGGTIHIIVNNQIGFTTVPAKGRSGMYASDLAKTINAPIFHVNADSMEDVHHVFRTAALYRQKFGNDVVIDLIGYRKMGHNELDQPHFTQPLMYQQVDKMTPVARIYEKQLLDEQIVTQEQINQMKSKIQNSLEASYAKSKSFTYKAEDWVNEQWAQIKKVDDSKVAQLTGLPIERLKETGLKISELPEDKNFHRLVKKIFEQRVKTIQDGKGIDWGTAEALAFSTLIQDGYNVRISGQDVERGTFSHRHAHVFYQDQPGYYEPISNAFEKGTTRKFIASNSHLSEFAVLGFELGYAQTHPNTLVLWEAQFGDFANGAQVIIDQFICSGEAKWNVKNGLVMLLPHGYDGQGPEHSSCRIERYLQLCDQDEFIPNNGKYENLDILLETNMQVSMPSTASNYFHLLRLQMRMPFRKPLVVVAPKKLLRFKGACSDIEDFSNNTSYLPLIKDQQKNPNPPEKITKVILCSGQVYYDLEAEREKLNRPDVAILRVESLCPFPFKEIITQLQQYKNAKITWAQEEPKNAGAWTYAHSRLRNILKHLNKKDTNIQYAGRPIMAATAVGFTKTHNEQLANLLKDAFN